MKIITQGEKPEEKVIVKTCYNCKTVFEFQKKEERSFSGVYAGCAGSGTYVNCPVCYRKVTVISPLNYFDR